MDLSLIATVWYANPYWWLGIAAAIVGLGFVIFVHELGHFLVAKSQGVKCDKFYLGFHPFGLKLFKFRYGETEYGIGILPLGGYVSMLGQVDNPAKLREEIERAKLQQPQAAGERAPAEVRDGESPKPGKAADDQEELSEAEVEAAKDALYNPRSYLAKSVPARMAIISAGVVMNLIFAWVLASVGFGFGVRQNRAGVGHTSPGGGAWKAGLRDGDEILEINGKKTSTFGDMMKGIALGDVKDGLSMLVQRPGEKEPRRFTVLTDSSNGKPQIGVAPPPTARITKQQHAAWPNTPAAAADPALKLGDTIVKINGRAIGDYADLQSFLAMNPDQPLTMTLKRQTAPELDGDSPTEEVTVRVGTNPMLHFGLVMEMGPITAIQTDSPAAAAGMRAGDVIRTYEGKPAGDPLTLADRLRPLAGRTVVFGVQREGEKDLVKVPVKLWPADRFDPPTSKDAPVAVPQLGVAYRVLNTVQEVQGGSPAEKAGLKKGDLLVAAKFIAPEKKVLKELQEQYPDADIEPGKFELTFDHKERDKIQHNWPCLIYSLQMALPGTKVQLQWKRGEEESEAKLEPVRAKEWFNPDRGFALEMDTLVRTASSFGEAVRWGGEEALDATLMVYRMIQKMGSGQISPRYLGGPISIVDQASYTARTGPGNFLMFLAMLSANLAVLNFLPIPVFDGGHMVFLTWEAIRGKPASERVQYVLTLMGLAFIILLMLFVFGLDLSIIPRPGK